jgi:hypothetical protein
MASSDDLDVSLSTWVHVLTRDPVLPTQATWTPMSAQEAQQKHVICLRAYQLNMFFIYEFAAAFSKFVCFFIANLSNQ